MSTRKPPVRGATRNPRGAPTRKAPPRGGNGRASGARKTPPASNHRDNGGIRKGRLLAALLLLAALVGGIVFVLKRPHKPVPPVPAALAEDKDDASAADKDQGAGKPGAQDAATASDDPAKQPNRFKFYDILPHQQVLPTRQLDMTPPRPRPAGSKPADAAAATQFWLQSGAFSSATEADHRRAQIRLLGLPARVSDGQDSQGLAVHRVIAGPFNTQTSVDNARRTLATAGMDAIPLDTPPQDDSQ